MNTVIVPAVITRDQQELELLVNKVKQAARIQLDCMDGKFVDNKSLDFNFQPPSFKGKYEAHLMVEDPTSWIGSHGQKVDLIIVHYQTIKDDPDTVFSLIRSKNKLVGMAINPEITISEVKALLPKIDQLLVMTVHPGFYGSAFVPETLDKIKEAKELFPELVIEVDGGMVPSTTAAAKKAGASVIVSGSFIMKSDDPLKAIAELEEA